MALAAADLSEVEGLVRSTGFFRSKARNLVAMAQAVVERFGAEMPSAMADLVTLPEWGERRPTWCGAWPSAYPGSPSTHTCNDCPPGWD